MYKIAVVAGGDSGEYEVSLKTADNVFQQLDKTLFEPYMILFKGTDWHYETPDGQLIQIDKNDFSLTFDGRKILFDAVFIAIHGTPGENGKLQSYFEMIKMPYVGCRSFPSALTFNKFYCNLAVKQLGVPIAPSLHFYAGDPMDIERIEEVCGYPCFVKSCNSGSSVGVTKVHGREELKTAFEEALKYDNQLIVEKMIHGRELACGVTAVYGDVKMLAITEIVAHNEFYDYDAKYTDVGHSLITPADIAPDMQVLVKQYAELVFRQLDCKGIVRVDFILDEEAKTPYFLEVNTIPGQTALSIIPAQVKSQGLDVREFYTKLLMEALV
ncbi:MAG: D-alanine--D-alanine ligase [Bacteroidales bacterium]|nr:D-alanine--D-alanine ligase [Bacteroidales bacterium]